MKKEKEKTESTYLEEKRRKKRRTDNEEGRESGHTLLPW
jgi:hypothetical protein